MHARIQKIFSGMQKTRRFANAYLFIGPAGSGKFDAALNFTKSINCTEENACGACAHCQKIEKYIHPDLLLVEKDGSAIKINQIRSLKDAVRYGPSEASHLVSIIKEADSLTPEAANSFLKVMEEPPPQTIFILITEKEDDLPLTIVSRCQKILFPESSGFQPDPKAEDFFNCLKQSQNRADILMLSKKFEADEPMLNSALFLCYQAGDLASARAILQITGDVKRKANKKLAMDALLLRLGDIWSKN